ncbi:MAG: fused MFS/spermidine synthase [bacterium]|nr:fused MFS/spermidine synthase [bacterium]
MSPDRRDIRLLPLVVFLSGFTFLVYEVCWHRQLALSLGATVAAATVVLSTFMAGLGAGAGASGRRADADTHPARLLALLLGGIGVLSAAGQAIVAGVVPALAGAPVAASYAVAIIALLVPAFLMGGLFPVLSRLAIGAKASITGSLGRLYAIETLGSAVGALATGFVLLGALGQRGTIALAVVMDLLLAGWLLAWSRRHEGSGVAMAAAAPTAEAPVPTASRKAKPADVAGGSGARNAILLATFTCGLASLALQVLWFRMFRVYFTNTSYTFALVAAVAIAGSFAGSAWLARRGPRPERRPRALSRAIALFGLLTLVALALAAKLPQVLMFPFESALADPYLRVLVIPLVAALLIVLPPAACAGYALPLACRLVVRDRGSLSRDVGFTLMVNTAGSVLGPVLAALVLLPWLGAVRSVLLVAAALLGAAALVGPRSGRPTLERLAPGAAAAVVLVTALLLPVVPILPPSFVKFGRDLLVYRETVEGTLSVGRDRGGPEATKYSFVNNSAVIGSSYDAVKAVKMVGHLPYLAGLDVKDVLVVGFGMGVTTSAIAAQPGVKSIECVELVPGLRDAAIHYRELNRDVARDPRLRLIAGDGRHHLQRSGRRYDLISCDPTHPILGSGGLYTAEWFRLCRDHLNPGGMVSQYLPLHKLGERELLGIIGTFHSVFPEGTVWLGQYHAVLLGTTTPLRLDFAQWSARVGSLGRDSSFHLEPYHLATTLVLDAAAIERLCGALPLNTDDRCYTEFFAPGCLDPDNLVRNLRLLAAARVAPASVFSNVPDEARLAVAARSQAKVTEALARLLDGDHAGGLALLEEARAGDPGDMELPFLLKLYR